jgi:hypothetical protein
MKSYLLAFGKALVTSTAIQYIYRRQSRKIFSEKPKTQEKLCFSRENSSVKL